ncbi:MAG: hypothetical protein R6V28_08215 [Nitriliruptoraceae bacterium]
MAETATAKKTTKKTAAKATAKKTTKKTAAKKTTARKTAPKRAPKTTTPRLRERELRTILEDAGYATAGLVGDVVELAKDLPNRLEHLRAEAGEAPTKLKNVREVPERVEETIAELRERLAKDTDKYLESFEGRFDSKAKEGRKLADEVRKDERVSRLLDQADNARSQVRGALTSVSKTADIAVETATEEADRVGSQAKATATTAQKAVDDTVSRAKGTVTTARKGVDATVSQAKGTVTAAKGAAEDTVEATEPQAKTAKSQVKGASTSVKKTAEAATDTE